MEDDEEEGEETEAETEAEVDFHPHHRSVGSIWLSVLRLSPNWLKLQPS